MKIIGIDYGSKLAGTTAISYNSDHKLSISQSEKGKNADQFIYQIVVETQPDIVAIDAPLSIPSGIVNVNAENYFYRACDKQLNAMSPMFLGGLTARAIKLKDQITKEFPKTRVIETYPKAQWNRMVHGQTSYKQKEEEPKNLVHFINHELPNFDIDLVSNWHCFDAILCWIGGFRYANGVSNIYGNQSEGQIFI